MIGALLPLHWYVFNQGLSSVLTSPSCLIRCTCYGNITWPRTSWQLYYIACADVCILKAPLMLCCASFFGWCFSQELFNASASCLPQQYFRATPFPVHLGAGMWVGLQTCQPSQGTNGSESHSEVYGMADSIPSSDRQEQLHSRG